MNKHLDDRRKMYYKIHSLLATMDDRRLEGLLDDTEVSRGWARNHVVKMGGTKVFVKRIPVTSLEYENSLSTTNLYRLPLYYNYGVGSAGFGVFRELIAHIKTTNWVLDGAIDNFPLMYHYRIVPYAGAHADIDLEEHRAYVKCWNGSKTISRYILDRAKAGYEAIVFLEHIPYMAYDRLCKDTDRINPVIRDMKKTIDFLRENGIIHFDVHLGNILTDGKIAYLTDFGLVLDRSFSMNQKEQAFFRRHRDYDYAELLCCIGMLLYPLYHNLSDTRREKIRRQYSIGDDRDFMRLIDVLLTHIEDIQARGLMRPGKALFDHMVRYRKVIRWMHDFLADMSRNNRKNTPFKHTALRRLLKETDFLPVKSG